MIRVELFKHTEVGGIAAVKNQNNDIFFWSVANKFKETALYDWVERNSINLGWERDDTTVALGSTGTIYANIDEKLYVEYALKF
jgi:hypothetical protein